MLIYVEEGEVCDGFEVELTGNRMVRMNIMKDGILFNFLRPPSETDNPEHIVNGAFLTPLELTFEAADATFRLLRAWKENPHTAETREDVE